ncbi:hypothetical protein DVH24_007769 [Malus domestica]|uniref:Protein kinase domain-containing protein n=1 Tax=Malus domestica TaxID=3750 RepID=A0A498JU34_MALDO|nr:hypothetical protein DVH24_007769 [Malus domestica]
MPSKLVKLFSRLPFFRKKEREWSYYKNLKKLLEDLFASGNGESHPIHCYSADEIIRATNNFHPSRIVTKSSGYKMFRGLLDGRSIIVCKVPPWEPKGGLGQMSHHGNVLKLLGCCLEFPIPVLVHEYVAKGVLNPDGSLRGANEDQIILPWNIRLRIAKQVASAVSYLHTAFAGHIIYVDLKPSCLFFDDDYVPKLYVFSHSITIPPVESDVEDEVTGTIGYIDPVYLWCKTDIYSFGVLLLVFLTGGKAVESDQVEGIGSLISYVQGCHCRLEAIVDPKIYEEVRRNVQVRHQLQHQLHDFLNLALLCIDRRTEGRRCMVDVARALIRIEDLREANEDRIILPSNVRLHIAKQVTSAVSYLHTAFARPIIHRDPKPSCLFLDDDYVPKLYNFLLSITIPPMVLGFEDDVTRTIGYIDIIYLWSNRIIEKTNMYSFGVLLLVFLTRRKDLESNQAEGIDLLISYVRSFDGRIEAVVDPKIYEEVRGNVQLHDFLNLTLLCTRDTIEGRPYLVDVARALIRIEDIYLEDLIASCDEHLVLCALAPLMSSQINQQIPSTLPYSSSYQSRGFLDDRYMVIHEIIISMQMSTHKNALITLGCYFKFPVPALVHEYITQGFIDCHGGLEDTKSLQWETILLIAKKGSNALAYLHTAFSRPIIHRDLKPACIF